MNDTPSQVTPLQKDRSILSRARNVLTATDKKITGDQLRQAMMISVVTGSGATIWFSTCAPVNLFNVYFKNYLGGSATQLGILVAITQLASMFQLFSIFIYDKLHTRKLFWAVCHVIHRMFGFVLAGVSFAVARGTPNGIGIKIIMGSLAISWILSTVATTGWWTWQTDLYPERIRATFFGKRSAVVNAVSMVWFFVVVLVLDNVKVLNVFYLYSIIFSIAGIAGVADIVFHTLIPEPRRKDLGHTTSLKSFLEPLKNKNFVRYACGIGLWAFSVNIAGPFIPPYITDKHAIGAPNTWLGITSTVSQIFWILSAGFWGKLMDRFGRKPVIIISAFSPIAWIGYLFLTSNNYFLLLPLLAFVGGLLGPGFGDGNMQLMLTITPDKNRTAYIAWYTTLIGLISAGGALLGGRLSDLFSNFHLQLTSFLTLNSFHIVICIAMILSIASISVINRVNEKGSKTVTYLLSMALRKKLR